MVVYGRWLNPLAQLANASDLYRHALAAAGAFVTKQMEVCAPSADDGTGLLAAMRTEQQQPPPPATSAIDIPWWMNWAMPTTAEQQATAK